MGRLFFTIFFIEKGKITGIVGPNVAGKSTMIKTILGLYHITSGNVYIDGFSAKHNLKNYLSGIIDQYQQLKKMDFENPSSCVMLRVE